jgi:hypothetical protein
MSYSYGRKRKNGTVDKLEWIENYDIAFIKINIYVIEDEYHYSSCHQQLQMK